MNSSKGITFLEIIIIMLVLTLFAAVIVPQFSRAAQEAKASRLAEILQEVRSYINIYKAQHNNMLPGQAGADWTQAMCSQTDEEGDLIDKTATAVKDKIILGPYMDEVPANPYNGLNSVDIDGTVGDNSHGWHFDTATGMFRADDSRIHSRF